MQIEHPVWCGYTSTFHFHATLARMLRPALIRDEVTQMRSSGEKRLLAPPGVVKAFHPEQFPLDSVVGLIQQGARHGYLRVLKDRIPARLLLLEPALDACPVGGSSRCRDVVDKTAQPLTQGKHTQALALSRPVEQGVDLGAERLTDRRCDGREFLGEFEERVAEAEAETCSRKQGAHTLRGAVKAIGEGPFDPI